MRLNRVQNLFAAIFWALNQPKVLQSIDLLKEVETYRNEDNIDEDDDIIEMEFDEADLDIGLQKQNYVKPNSPDKNKKVLISIAKGDEEEKEN